MITGETPATPPPVPCPAAVGFLQDLSLNAQGYALVEHEVVYRPGNDGRAYSQSRNA
ncbi:hypothetical protein [Streptomyces milbemycinicus]|uniref:hypothetical protein n=1 Tax=Streptomyces milbemycinicus TaxID=476552 RepID=UPI0033D021D1